MMPQKSVIASSNCWLSDSTSACRACCGRWRNCRGGLSDADPLDDSGLMWRRVYILDHQKSAITFPLSRVWERVVMGNVITPVSIPIRQ